VRETNEWQKLDESQVFWVLGKLSAERLRRAGRKKQFLRPPVVTDMVHYPLSILRHMQSTRLRIVLQGNYIQSARFLLISLTNWSATLAFKA
jgi:hypothetical protein